MAKFQYKHYMLLLLTVVAISNYLDRGVLSLAMEPIKAEFQLSDGQLGLMSGIAFALFYAVAGIPIARWADRGNRNHVITLVAMLWSGMLVLCSMVGNFTQLLLVRVGVAVGESGCVPPAQSLISDYFDRAERPRAMAIYWLCGPIATIISFIAGGWLIDQLGWRTAFVAIGLPGVILAIVVKLTLREPRLTGQSTVVTTTAQMPMKAVLATLWRVRAFRHVAMTYCLLTFFSTGTAVWFSPFFMRSHGMNATELGIWVGLGSGVGGLLSTYLGGYLATRYAGGKESVQMKGVAFLCLLSGIVCILCWLSENTIAALLLKTIAFGGLLPMVMPSIFSGIQALVEERTRAVSMAFVLMFSNLIGLGLGPVAVGLVSDALAPAFGQESLRYTLLLFTPGYLWCAFHALKAATTIEDDIQLLEEKAALRQKKETESAYDQQSSTADNFQVSS